MFECSLLEFVHVFVCVYVCYFFLYLHLCMFMGTISNQRNKPFKPIIIPLQRKTICVGSWHWLRPPMPQFCVGDMLVSKISVTPNAKHKSPKQANGIFCAWDPMQNICIGHVHFMLFVLISFVLVTQQEPSL